MENDFWKEVEKKGLIKEASEAFKEFPVEEEWHKGNIDVFLKEENIEYGNYKVGDIIFVKKYCYINGEKGTNHLFVIIEKNNYAVPIEYMSMLISSQLNKLKFNENKLLVKSKLNNLKRDSIVKTDVIYKIKEEDILFEIGKVDKKSIKEYMKNLERLF